MIVIGEDVPTIKFTNFISSKSINFRHFKIRKHGDCMQFECI